MATNGKVMEEASSSSTLRKQENNLESEGISDHLFSGDKLHCLSQLLHAKGEGSSVFKGFWKENGKEKEVAVRRIKVSECTENWKDIVDSHLTGSLSHDNVLKVFGYKEGSDQFRYFALEQYGGTLEQFCNGQYTGPMPSDAQVLYQIANGVNYLHTKKLCHGNLNPQTILISHGQPVRMKISDFGLRKCVDFSNLIPNDNGSFHSQRDGDPTDFRRDNVVLHKMSKLTIKGKPQTKSFTFDDDGASFISPTDATADPIEMARVSNTNPMTNTARNGPKDSSSHPGNWMLAGSWTEFTDQDEKVSIQLNPTVYGDVFAAGCLFFYFLPTPSTRGLHPFGNAGTVIANISAKNSVNLNKLDPKHFANESIRNLLGDPPTDGTQWLHIAARTFQDVLPLKIDESKMIGRGGFGIVFAGTFQGNDVAVKKISVEVVEENPTDFEREMKLHKELDHENVLKLLHIDVEKDPLFKYLVLELCCGTLSQYCDKKKRESEGKPYKRPDLPDLPPDVVVLYQIAVGLDYIHSRNLVHRDIKPDNVLISTTKPAHVKLSDFGYCKRASPQGTFSQSGLKGTLNWMAPEMLEILNGPDNAPEDLPHGTIESDTFSAGCVFFFLMTLGSHPFGNPSFVPANICSEKPVTFHHIAKKLKDSLKEGDERCQDLYDLIGKMIRKKEERIALTQVIQQLTALLPENRQFKANERSFPQIWGHCWSRFHSTKQVLACGSTGSSTVILLKGANGSIPFSNWRIVEQEFKRQTQSGIYKLEWNVNGTQLAAGCADGTVIVWSYPSGRKIFEEKKHSSYVDLIAWNPFRQDVLATRQACGWRAKDLLFWNSRGENGDAEKANHFLTRLDKEIWSVAWISANQIAIGLRSGWIEICKIDEDKGTSRFVKRFRHSESEEEEFSTIMDLQWNDRTKYLASSSLDGWINIWSMDSDQPVHSLQVHVGCLRLALRRNGKTDNDGAIDVERKAQENFILACGLHDGSVVIWNPLEENEENRKRILPQKHSIRVLSLSFSPDGRFLASADYGGQLIIWSTETWLPVFTCKNDTSGLSWMFTDSSFVPTYKLAVESKDKVRVIEQSYAE